MSAKTSFRVSKAHGTTQKTELPRTYSVSHATLFSGTDLNSLFIHLCLCDGKASDRTITVWSSTVDLAPGEIIESSDIAPVQVQLPENAAQYLDGSAFIVGASVLRSIGAAELIPSFAISSELEQSLVQVPISVPRELIPTAIRGGAIVDIYGLPNRNNQMLQNDSSRTRLIMSEITIDSVDDSARELGGRVGATLLVPNDLVLRIVAAMSDYELLLVKRTRQL